MKPNIQIERLADLRQNHKLRDVRITAQFTVDGMTFTSDFPFSVAEAIEINTAIERLVEAVKP